MSQQHAGGNNNEIPRDRTTLCGSDTAMRLLCEYFLDSYDHAYKMVKKLPPEQRQDFDYNNIISCFCSPLDTNNLNLTDALERICPPDDENDKREVRLRIAEKILKTNGSPNQEGVREIDFPWFGNNGKLKINEPFMYQIVHAVKNCLFNKSFFPEDGKYSKTGFTANGLTVSEPATELILLSSYFVELFPDVKVSAQCCQDFGSMGFERKDSQVNIQNPSTIDFVQQNNYLPKHFGSGGFYRISKGKIDQDLHYEMMLEAQLLIAKKRLETDCKGKTYNIVWPGSNCWRCGWDSHFNAVDKLLKDPRFKDLNVRILFSIDFQENLCILNGSRSLRDIEERVTPEKLTDVILSFDRWMIKNGYADTLLAQRLFPLISILQKAHNEQQCFCVTQNNNKIGFYDYNSQVTFPDNNTNDGNVWCLANAGDPFTNPGNEALSSLQDDNNYPYRRSTDCTVLGTDMLKYRVPVEQKIGVPNGFTRDKCGFDNKGYWRFKGVAPQDKSVCLQYFLRSQPEVAILSSSGQVKVYNNFLSNLADIDEQPPHKNNNNIKNSQNPMLTNEDVKKIGQHAQRWLDGITNNPQEENNNQKLNIPQNNLQENQNDEQENEENPARSTAINEDNNKNITETLPKRDILDSNKLMATNGNNKLPKKKQSSFVRSIGPVPVVNPPVSGSKKSTTQNKTSFFGGANSINNYSSNYVKPVVFTNTKSTTNLNPIKTIGKINNAEPFTLVGSSFSKNALNSQSNTQTSVQTSGGLNTTSSNNTNTIQINDNTEQTNQQQNNNIDNEGGSDTKIAGYIAIFLGLAGGGFGGATVGDAIDGVPKSVGAVVLVCAVLAFFVGVYLIATSEDKNKQQPINNNKPNIGTQNTSKNSQLPPPN